MDKCRFKFTHQLEDDIHPPHPLRIPLSKTAKLSISRHFYSSAKSFHSSSPIFLPLPTIKWIIHHDSTCSSFKWTAASNPCPPSPIPQHHLPPFIELQFSGRFCLGSLVGFGLWFTTYSLNWAWLPDSSEWHLYTVWTDLVISSGWLNLFLFFCSFFFF